MPIVWTSDTEARLLAGLFRVCDIKVGKKELEELAEIIGPDCTPKAVSHRLQKFKTMAAKFNGGKKGGDAAQNDESAPVTPKKDTPSKKGGTGGKKRAAEANDDEEDGEDVAKKVKVEVDAEANKDDPDLI